MSNQNCNFRTFFRENGNTLSEVTLKPLYVIVLSPCKGVRRSNALENSVKLNILEKFFTTVASSPNDTIAVLSFGHKLKIWPVTALTKYRTIHKSMSFTIPLTSKIKAMSGPFSHWLSTVKNF